MEYLKKVVLFGVCAVLCAGAFSQVNAECITLRMFDGGVSAGGGVALVGAGLGTILIPGFLFHAFAQQNGSAFFRLCALVSYLSGIIMVAGGTKIVYDGIKKLFGVNRTPCCT